MIVAEAKPIEEIAAMIKGAKKAVVIGCGGCVTVCLSGGQKETDILASALRMKMEVDGTPVDITTATFERQCDPEYAVRFKDYLKDADFVVSMACGAGVQYMAETYPEIKFVPGQNTKFVGATVEHGVWEERCALCGECVLDKTGGVCPIIRCSKSLLNGPCGGSQDGVCEISKDTPCGWQLIYDRLKGQNRLEMMSQIIEVKDWSKNRDGGPRKIVREDVRL
ncbi:MAG TPA: methylenetetrahydrofolate reductase C-terminal domain-containing protein [Patescibacteria group bacterium]|nr:methylenetetrahydrofolate reductase C-terminal domain-containing protein [Patescibacteria group bacterium]